MEDFAQILGLYPEQKYQQFNYETIARLILAISGPLALDEYLLRLLFVIASGNGDAHHKNWTLLYRDPIRPELSPAYDLVSTIQYFPDDNLALNLSKSKRFSDVDLAAFQRMARKIGLEEADMGHKITQYRDAILTAWEESKSTGYLKAEQKRLERHMQNIPLFRLTQLSHPKQ